MLILKIMFVIFIVFIALFILSLLVYFFNLDMKAASLLIPFMTKLYDRRDRKKKK